MRLCLQKKPRSKVALVRALRRLSQSTSNSKDGVERSREKGSYLMSSQGASFYKQMVRGILGMQKTWLVRIDRALDLCQKIREGIIPFVWNVYLPLMRILSYSRCQLLFLMVTEAVAGNGSYPY